MGKWNPQFENQQPETMRSQPRSNHLVRVLCDKKKDAHVLCFAYRDTVPEGDSVIAWHYFDGRGGVDTIRPPSGRLRVSCSCSNREGRYLDPERLQSACRDALKSRRVVTVRLAELLIP